MWPLRPCCPLEGVSFWSCGLLLMHAPSGQAGHMLRKRPARSSQLLQHSAVNWIKAAQPHGCAQLNFRLEATLTMQCDSKSDSCPNCKS